MWLMEGVCVCVWVEGVCVCVSVWEGVCLGWRENKSRPTMVVTASVTDRTGVATAQTHYKYKYTKHMLQGYKYTL